MEYQTGVKKKDTLEITELLNAKKETLFVIT